MYNSGRPGVMLYFDGVAQVLERLTDEQAGQLFKAIFAYALAGEIKDLDPLAAVVFDLLRPKIDRDAERYDSKVLKSRYAVWCRENVRKGGQPVSFEQWKNMQAQRDQGVEDAVEDADVYVFEDAVVDESAVADDSAFVVGYRPISSDSERRREADFEQNVRRVSKTVRV